MKAWRTVARKATPPAFYWLALSLIAFLGMREVVKIEAARTRLFLVVVVVGVAFCTACFLERLLRDYLLIDKEPKVEPRDVSGNLPKWLNCNRGKGEWRAEPRIAFVTPTVNALSFWEDNWPSLAQVPLVVAWQPKFISKDEVLRIAANIAKLPELARNG